MDELLNIKNLDVIYKTEKETVYAVNDLTFSCKKGENVGIVGETGAGKTTLALSILRLLPERTGRITGGSITFDGIDILSASPEEMREIRGDRIAMIFQDPMSALIPVHTVGDQIAEALLIHNKEKRTKHEIDAEVDKTLELVGIPAERKKDYPHQFSGGMKQRVVIAIALACKPDLLIADEPTTALDVTIQAQVLAMMNDLQEKLNMSMIMITHDLDMFSNIKPNKVFLLANHKIQKTGGLEIIDEIIKNGYKNYEQKPKKHIDSYKF